MSLLIEAVKPEEDEIKYETLRKGPSTSLTLGFSSINIRKIHYEDWVYLDREIHPNQTNDIEPIH